MSNYPHPIIAREGWLFVGLALVVAIGLSFTPWWPLTALAWLAVLFVVQFFRDPPRVVPQQTNAVLAPADGRVLRVEKARDPYLERDAIMISIFMNVFNVHVNRVPVDGTVTALAYRPGKFINASFDKASEDNERMAIAVRRADGRLIGCVQIAGWVARHIICNIKPGQAVAAGERFGHIRFGSRTDLYLPTGARLLVAEGQRMIGGETVVAELDPADATPRRVIEF